MAKQGKCEECKIRWLWDREIKLDQVCCPNCESPLKQTWHKSSYQVRLHTVTTNPEGLRHEYLSGMRQ